MKRTHFICLIWLFCASFASNATHIIGSDWSYTCIPGSNGKFRVQLVLYRDCSGWAEFGTSMGCAGATVTLPRIGADVSCNGTNFGSVTLSLVSVRDVNPNPRCASAKSICTNCGLVTPGTFTPGVERYVFEGIVDLGPTSGIPSSCCQIRFSYSQCCRNGSISNGGANANFYTDMIIERCRSVSACNSSPTYSNDPAFVTCNNQPFTLNAGGVDPDLDSLSYEFVPSLASQGRSIGYNPPFAFDRPMPWTGPVDGSFPLGIRCNPTTGDVSFTPQVQANFIGTVAIGIKQWQFQPSTQTYVFVGQTRRDMQVWLKTCATNAIPYFSTVPALFPGSNSPKFQHVFIAGQPSCIEIAGLDSNLTDTTFLAWDNSLGRYGASFIPNYNPINRTTNGPREDTYRFCWTPHDSTIDSKPYLFGVRAEDNQCPLQGSLSATFSVQVIAPPISSIRIQSLQTACNQYSFTPLLQITDSVKVNRVEWTIARDHLFLDIITQRVTNGSLTGVAFPTPGKYYIRCVGTLVFPQNSITQMGIIDSLIITDTLFGFTLHDTDFCNQSSIQLKPTLVHPGQFSTTYQWSSATDPTVILGTADTFTVNNTGQNQQFILQVSNQTGCTLMDTILVRARKQAVSYFISGPADVQKDKQYTYEVTQTPGMSYRWSISGGVIFSGQGTHKVTVIWVQSGIGRLSCNEQLDGCTHDSLHMSVRITLPPVVNALDDHAAITPVRAYPNPVSEVLFLDSYDGDVEHIVLSDITGRHTPLPFVRVSHQTIRVPLASLSSGIYMLQVYFANGNRTPIRIVKSY